jgi:hypothetical protein
VKEPTVEERIRIRAYELWQRDGSMEGCADEYCRQAREVIEQELREEQAGSPACTGDQTQEGGAATAQVHN